MVFNTSIRYADEKLMIDDCDVETIVGKTGTPTYTHTVYKRVVEKLFGASATSFNALNAHIHYSVKANGSLAILRGLKDAGAGFDCVSGGEIYRALHAGAQAEDIVFAGVGKTRQEIAFAIDSGVGWFNVENVAELDYIQQRRAG